MNRICKYLFLTFFLLQAVGLLGMDVGDSLFVVSEILVSGNKITREKIIFKELTFSTGDSLTQNEIIESCDRSRENLLNTSLFNFVNISHFITGGTSVLVYISVIERWYIWPSPIFEHAERNLGAFIHQPNWNRINYGGQIYWYNFRGRNEQLKLKMRFGYKEQYELMYDKPNFGRHQQHGVNFTLNTTRQHEVNVYSRNNKPVYIRNDDSYLSEALNPYFIYSYRSTLYSKHFIQLAYIAQKYRDSATHEYFTGLPYGKNPEWAFFEYSYEYDYRDLKAYPLKGNYLRVNLNYLESLVPANNATSTAKLLVVASHHEMLAKRLFYNDALRLELSKDKYQPKIVRTGLGYGQYLRGYELFTIDGSSYGILVNNLKYCLLQQQTYNLHFIPWSQFNPVHFSMYANLFFDMGYVQGKAYSIDGNDYENRLLYTAGLGLDLVSYYDQVLRLEFSLNREGQPGFFIHSEVPFSRW